MGIGTGVAGLGVSQPPQATLEAPFSRSVPYVPPHYIAPAVHFDGSTFLHLASLTSTDSAVLSFSFWAKYEAGHASHSFINWAANDANTAATAPVNGGGAIQPFDISVSDGMTFCEVVSTVAPTYAVWFNLIGSLDVSTNNDYKVKFYLDDVDVTDTIAQDVAFTILTNGLNFSVGCSPNGNSNNFVFGDMADLWVAPNVSLLNGSGDIPEATRRLFIDADGKPVDPSGFPAGAVLLSGNASAFATNQGSGGAFTTTGTLTNASSSPSD